MWIRGLRAATPLAILLAAALWAQQDQTSQNDSQTAGWGTKIVELKYLDPEQLRSVFAGRSYIMEANRELKLLTVNGPPQFLKEVEEIGKRLDVPPRLPANIQVWIYLLSTMPFDSAQALPPELAAIGKDLTVPAAGPPFRMIDSQMVRMREGQPCELTYGEMSGTVPSIMRVKIRAAVASSDPPSKKDSQISLDGIECRLNKPAAANSSQTHSEGDISASVDLAQGRPTILARSGLERPMVVVIRAAIVP